jgi:predicted MFS family arabinose efflux permease
MASTDYSLRRSRLPSARGGTRREFLLVAAALFVMLMGSNMATPLYAVYRERYGFSAVVLTLIFAIYAAVLVPSLLFFGHLSDRFGRRPVMAAGIVGGAVGLALFASADGIAWLFAARAVQALGTGLMTAAAAAALVELEPGGHHDRAAVATVLGNNGGSAAGPLVAGLLAQWAPDRLVLCYLTGIACLAFALLGVLSIHDPVTAGGRWRPQRPSVPGPIRVRFARASLTGASVWGVGGLFLSVVPSYAGQLLHTDDLALLGAIAGLTLGASCAAQLVLLRGDVSPHVAQPAGLMMVVAGVGLLILAFPLGSLACLLAAAGLAGFGNGTALFGAQTEINLLAPGKRRGEVTAAFIASLYGGVAVTAVGAGLLADAYGLSTAVAVIGAIVAGVAAMTALWHMAARRAGLAEQELPR